MVHYQNPEDETLIRKAGNLLDALHCLETDTVLGKSLGESFVASYLKLKYQQWNRFNNHITNWELENTFER